MIAHAPNLDTILKRHEIHAKFWPEFRAYIEEGVQPSDELLTRLHHVANYKAALREAMHDIGNPHEFPPDDYKSPVSYESLLAEDIVVSPGVPSAAR